ncbi:unnamed protein product [Laminaria digitata]
MGWKKTNKKTKKILVEHTEYQVFTIVIQEFVCTVIGYFAVHRCLTGSDDVSSIASTSEGTTQTLTLTLTAVRYFRLNVETLLCKINISTGKFSGPIRLEQKLSTHGNNYLTKIASNFLP